MAFTENMQTRSYVAGSDLSAKQFRFVSLAADGAVDATGAGAAAAGVLLNSPAAGAAAGVAYDGRVTVVCGGTVTRGGEVASDAAGEAVDATTDDAILGYALETGADGQVITIELARGNTLAL
jgi:hypothetical protein